MKHNIHKIAILTRTSTKNFGTVLQAYALEKHLINAGYDAFIIDDAFPRKLYSFSNQKCDLPSKKNLKELIYNKYDNICERLKVRVHNKTLKAINKFKKKYMRFFFTDNPRDLNSFFDAFISGSDQIWATSAEPELFPFFMQDFVYTTKTKLSYAVSIGEKSFPKDKSELVTQLLSSFDAIAVRELSSKQTLKQYTDKSVEITCDPVFFIASKDWSSLAGNRIIKEKYVFAYFLSDNDWYFEKISDFLEQNECPVYIYGNVKKLTDNENCIYIDACSPCDFLNYIEYADFVFTDSFHATMFSIIFKRGFNTFERFNTEDNTQNGRLNYVLKKLSLDGYYIKKDTPFNHSIPDYNASNDKLNAFIDKSKNFLSDNLF